MLLQYATFRAWSVPGNSKWEISDYSIMRPLVKITVYKLVRVVCAFGAQNRSNRTKLLS